MREVTIKVTRCYECPFFQIEGRNTVNHCLNSSTMDSPTYLYDQNKDGITPSCPMFAQSMEVEG